MPEKYRCPACSSVNCELFLSRSNVPVQQNILTANLKKAVSTPRGNLEMVFCHDCEFVFNAAFDNSLFSYDADYNNTQESSACFRDHLETLKQKLISEHFLKHSTIAEIGCGKGHFLKMLVLDEKLDNIGFGFDPSYVGEEQLAGGRLTFEKKYFNGSCRGFKADALLCRHVIEHIAEPMNFLQEIKSALVDSSGSRLFFETPCVNWIFENQVIWDFFYEHCSLFNQISLGKIFNRVGFCVNKISHVFGNQYLWLEGEGKTKISTAENFANSGTADKMRKFVTHEKKTIARWHATVSEKCRTGKLGVWGAGAKGVTFVNLIDPDCEKIELVIDLNPEKHQKFIPGSGHPVCGPETAFKAGVRNIIVMNPNYIEEIRATLGDYAEKINLITEPGE